MSKQDALMEMIAKEYLDELTDDGLRNSVYRWLVKHYDTIYNALNNQVTETSVSNIVVLKQKPSSAVKNSIKRAEEKDW